MPTLTIQVLGPTETAVMNVAWSHAGTPTVRDVHRQLDCELAYSTVMMTMEHLAEKGILLWAPAVQASAGLSLRRGDLTAILLAGAVEQLCAQLGADAGDRSVAFAALLGRPRR